MSTPRPGLRERKKIQTRQAIRKAAYRLFAEQGYDATPVDQIADEADVSPSTVFRYFPYFPYFPTKEDIVLRDEYDPLLHAALIARPAGEPPTTALRNAVIEVFEQVMQEDPGREPTESEQRMRLVTEVPALRARTTESMAVSGQVLASALAERTGRDGDELELRAYTGALPGALAEAMFYWGDHGQREDLFELVDRALGVVESGLSHGS